MKKVIFSLFFCSFLVLGANAQKASCSKTCTKGSSASACAAKAPGSAALTSDSETNAAAMKLASMDASIETRTDATTGNVTYVRKETCAHSGSVSFADVNYDATSNTFVNVSPMKMEEGAKTGKASCTSGAATGKSCCAGKAGAVKSAEKVKS